MTLTIDLKPETEEWLEREASRHGQPTSEYIRTALERMRPENLIDTIDNAEARVDSGWASLTALIDKCQVDTGVTDFAHQHDHYIHGTPKRED